MKQIIGQVIGPESQVGHILEDQCKAYQICTKSLPEPVVLHSKVMDDVEVLSPKALSHEDMAAAAVTEARGTSQFF